MIYLLRQDPALTTRTNGSMTWSMGAVAGSGLEDASLGTITMTQRMNVMRSVSAQEGLLSVSCPLCQVHAREITMNGIMMRQIKLVGKY